MDRKEPESSFSNSIFFFFAPIVGFKKSFSDIKIFFEYLLCTSFLLENCYDEGRNGFTTKAIRATKSLTFMVPSMNLDLICTF